MHLARGAAALTAALLTAALSLSPAAAVACGMGTHGELANRALYYFDASQHAFDYGALLRRHPDAFQAGAPFPDWGYACGYHDAGEDAHWQPFVRVAAQYIHDTYPQPWDESTEELVAWLMGSTAHSMSDITWHGLGISQGFIDALSEQDFHGDWGTAHTYADTGADMVLARSLTNSWLTPRWYVPTEDIAAIYERYYGQADIPPQIIERCVGLLFLGTAAEALAGQLAYPYFAKDSPDLEDLYVDYFNGGLDDMAIWSAWTWQDVIGWIEGGATNSGDTWWASMNASRVAARAMTPLHDDVGAPAALAEALGLRLITERRGRGVEMRLDPASMPTSLRDRLGAIRQASQEGHDLAFALEAGLAAGPLTPHRRDALEEEALTAAGWGLGRGLGEADFTVASPYTYLGHALATGDYNRDGRGDLALGAYGAGDATAPQDGALYAVYGGSAAAFGAALPPAAGAAGGFGGDARFGAERYGRLGYSLATVDFNADGVDDLAVGSPTRLAGHDGYPGQVQVYFGHGGDGLSEAPDVTFYGQGTFSGFGHRLRGADVDGDGHADLIVSSPYHRQSQDQQGAVWVFLSGPDRLSGDVAYATQADFTRVGAQRYSWTGWDTALLVTEGGRRLLLIGAPGQERDGMAAAGRVEGWDLTDLAAGLIPAEPTFTLSGDRALAKLGTALAVGRPWPDRGEVLAVSSPTRDEGDTYQTGWIEVYEVGALTGDVGAERWEPLTRIIGDQHFARLGWSLSLSDVDGDGDDDLLAGEPLHRSPSGHQVGAAYLWEGGRSFPEGVITSPRASADRAVAGDEEGARLGEAVLAVDFDGLGEARLVIAAPRSSSEARLGGGVFLVDP